MRDSAIKKIRKIRARQDHSHWLTGKNFGIQSILSIRWHDIALYTITSLGILCKQKTNNKNGVFLKIKRRLLSFGSEINTISHLSTYKASTIETITVGTCSNVFLYFERRLSPVSYRRQNQPKKRPLSRHFQTFCYRGAPVQIYHRWQGTYVRPLSISRFRNLKIQPCYLFTSPCSLWNKMCCVFSSHIHSKRSNCSYLSYLPYTAFENMKTFWYFLERDREDKKD